MGIIHFEGGTLLGNFAKVSKKKPKGYDKEYKVYVPYSFKWREKIGGVECDCKTVLECFMPWYGFTWYHSDECALMIRLKEKPQLKNLLCYQSLPFLAQSE